MAHDPKELFVTNAITRESIAQDLNDYLDAMRSDDTNVVEFTANDKRLTKKVCTEYAAFLGKQESTDFDNDEWADYLHTLANNLGAKFPIAD